MIEFKQGNLFESECQTLVNATNTEGFMGGGIALVFRKRYPYMYEGYKFRCAKGEHTVDTPWLWDVDPKWVLCLATKDKVREPSKLKHIEAGLIWLIQNYQGGPGQDPITSIAFPALGCGLGGLNWRTVKPLMEDLLSRLEIPVEIYEPLA